jgi:hypothetical protein
MRLPGNFQILDIILQSGSLLTENVRPRKGKFCSRTEDYRTEFELGADFSSVSLKPEHVYVLAQAKAIQLLCNPFGPVSQTSEDSDILSLLWVGLNGVYMCSRKSLY